MGEEEVASASNSSTPVPCEECEKNPWKYKCPGCSIRTCSLPCVRSHKARTSCTGQRNRAQFVPLSQFNDDLLVSDYNFLEEALRATESARRMRSIPGGCPAGTGRHSGFKMRMLGVLRKAAFRRKMRLFLLPAGMSKREKNQSRFNRRTNTIFWTIEWRFHSTDVILTDHSVDERMNLITLMGKHLQPTPWNHKLKPFCDESVECLKFFLQKFPQDPKSSFLQLNPAAPLGSQITGVTVVEYPIVLVYLPTQIPDFHVEVFKWSPPCNVELGGGGGGGSFFREEEVEDDDTADHTRVLDLSESGSVVLAAPSVTSAVLMAAPPVSSAGDRSMETGSAGGSLEEGGCFDFEGELMRDAYCDLLSEMNPDDFLCFDQDFSDGGDVGEACDGLLEEGEIPDCH